MAVGQEISVATVRSNLAFVNNNLPSFVNSRINASGTDRARSGNQIRTSYVPGVPNFTAVDNPIDDDEIRAFVRLLSQTFAVVRTFRFTAVGCGSSYLRRSVWQNLGNTSGTNFFDSFGGSTGNVILDQTFINSNSSIRTTILNNETRQDANFNYCHCSCHGSCHGSRGRR